MLTSHDLIQKFNLKKHIEGGYFKRVYESKYKFQFPGDNDERHLSTAIYFLLEDNDFSAFHRLKSDEIWIYNYGSPVTIYVIDEQGKLQEIILGDPKNPIFQITMRANLWFAAEVKNKSSFTLLSCFVSPGFEYDDFELADRGLLTNQYPQYAEVIHRLTRVEPGYAN